jgi:hypothetical protein
MATRDCNALLENGSLSASCNLLCYLGDKVGAACEFRNLIIADFKGRREISCWSKGKWILYFSVVLILEVFI